MFYSVHDPIKGGFNYFDAPDKLEINGDHPVPKFPSKIVSKLGVSALQAGRALPANAKPAGHGPLPKGRVASVWVTGGGGTAQNSPDPSGLGAWEVSQSSIVGIGLAVVAVVAVVWAFSWEPSR